MTIYNNYKYINFENGLLDNIIDAVYIITLENSSRINDVYIQINDLRLCKRNIVQINKRYTEYYNNNLYKQTTYYHLLYNNIEIFKHANTNNYNNILVLEDDFIFTNNIKCNKTIKDLQYFINNTKFNLIYLGNIPIIYIPIKYDNFYYVIFNGQAHSIIYSKNGRDIIINQYNKNKNIKYLTYEHHDMWYNSFINNRYFYYKPICYQVLENTENSISWNNSISNFIINIFSLNKKNSNNYNNYYTFTYILHIVFIIIIFKSII